MTTPLTPDRWQMREESRAGEIGYVIEWVDSGKPLTSNFLSEKEALRLCATYNAIAATLDRERRERVDPDPDTQNERRNTPHKDSWVDGFRVGMITAGVRPPWPRSEADALYDRTWPTGDDPFVAPEMRR